MSSDYQPPNPFSQFGQPPGPPNPYGGPSPWGPNPGGPGGYYQQPPPSRLSLPALFSLLSALFAPVLFCLCIPTILGSLAAVVLGHIGLYQVQRSEGRLHGAGLAIAGLLLGYPLLLISGVMAVPYLTGFGEGMAKSAPDSPEARLNEAESKIMSKNRGVSHGNTPEAEELAQEFGSLMKELREALFTEDKRKAISLTGGNFVTYCELRDGKCAFLVHVPAYRKFDDDAKESLAELAWMTAQSAVQGKLAPGDDLAVGMKGSILYGSVMIGKVAAADEKSQPDEEGTDKDALLPFFEGDDPAPAAVPARGPAAEEPATNEPALNEPVANRSEIDLSEPAPPPQP
jgi:hypothetical protein